MKRLTLKHDRGNMDPLNLFTTGILAATSGYVAKCGFGIYEDYRTHKYRPYNHDDDLSTDDQAALENPNTGSVGLLIIHKSIFWGCPEKRGFYCSKIERQPCGSVTRRKKKYTFAEFRQLRQKYLTDLPDQLSPAEVEDIKGSPGGVLLWNDTDAGDILAEDDRPGHQVRLASGHAITGIPSEVTSFRSKSKPVDFVGLTVFDEEADHGCGKDVPL